MADDTRFVRIFAISSAKSLSGKNARQNFPRVDTAPGVTTPGYPISLLWSFDEYSNSSDDSIYNLQVASASSTWICFSSLPSLLKKKNLNPFSLNTAGIAVNLLNPKILNNLSVPSLNYFKIRHFVHV